jgi:hypothetical protein
MSNNNTSGISRRKMLTYTIVGAATASATSWMLGLIPIRRDNDIPHHTTPQPSGNFSLHIVRFVGGVILDAVEAVLVDLSQEWMMNCIKGNCVVNFYDKPPENENQFNHPVYKGAISSLGLLNTVPHQKRQLAVQLINDQQYERFETLHKYLMDNKIRIKLATDNYSHLVTINMPVDDLFTLEYLSIDEADKPRHYEKMIEITGVELFEQWYG